MRSIDFTPQINLYKIGSLCIVPSVVSNSSEKELVQLEEIAQKRKLQGKETIVLDRFEIVKDRDGNAQRIESTIDTILGPQTLVHCFKNKKQRELAKNKNAIYEAYNATINKNGEFNVGKSFDIIL